MSLYCVDKYCYKKYLIHDDEKINEQYIVYVFNRYSLMILFILFKRNISQTAKEKSVPCGQEILPTISCEIFIQAV